MLWEFLLVVLVIWFVQRRWLLRRQRALANQLHSRYNTVPFLGHCYMFLGDDEHQMKAIQNLGQDALDHGGISKFMYFDQLLVCVSDPVVAEVILTQCLEKHSTMKVVNFVVEESSIIAPVPIWRHRRKIIQPLFKTKNLNEFVGIFSEHAVLMKEQLSKEADKGVFSFWDYISTFSFSNACRTTFGVKVDEKSASEIKLSLEKLWHMGTYLVVHPWLQSKFVQNLIPHFVKYYGYKSNVWKFVIETIRKKKEEETCKVLSFGKEVQTQTYFIKTQMEANEHQKFTDVELHQESLTLLVAGFDTTAIAMGFTAVLLATHPEQQDKVYKEVVEVFGESKRAVCPEDLPKLKYMEAFIKESLRLYPLTPALLRDVDRDITLPSGLTLVKDCGVLVNLWSLHRNPAYWGPDADTFRPERFLEGYPLHPAAFMAFGYGQRNCVGYRYAMISMKTVLVNLLREYQFLPAPGQSRKPLKAAFNLIIKHADNYKLRIQKRN